MKIFKWILIAVCILIVLLAVFCLISEIGGGGPEVVYAVQTGL